MDREQSKGTKLERAGWWRGDRRRRLIPREEVERILSIRGIPEAALLVDPSDESVLAFRPDRPASAWSGTDRIEVSEVVPDFELSVDQLFASLRQR